jgi:beta-galactosidase GanA
MSQAPRHHHRFRNLRVRAALLLFGVTVLGGRAEAAPPALRGQGQSTQLLVDGKPFLILGGELANSSPSSLAHLEPAWARFEKMHLNTVLAPVSWELIEPVEGRFDFSSVDGLLRQARAHRMRLVLLWFGSWKNSMSSYVPGWVKRDTARFPRAQVQTGAGVEILSAFSEANQRADSLAFGALMKHLKAVDAGKNTVLMVQVENEVAMLPTAREHGAEANRRFAEPVPQPLIDHIVAHRSTLVPAFRQLWESNGAKKSGNWTQLFGSGPVGEEVFTAYHLARYVDAVTAVGKAAYALPLYTNVALNRPGKRPGEYPSGGPLPHLLDVWKVAAPSLDFLAPDIYFPNFSAWVRHYARSDNPLFIPEANHARLPQAGASAFFAIGEYGALGVSPFSIDTLPEERAGRLGRAFAVLTELAPTLLANQGQGRVRGFAPVVSYEGKVDDSPQTIRLGDFQFEVSFIDPWIPKDEQQTIAHGGLLIQLGPEEYLAAGSGFVLEMTPISPGPPIAGIESIWEGRFVGGRWVPGRLLNGDESHQGRHLRIPPHDFGIQRLKLYRYR